jgi:hypothetical protein
MPKFYLIDMLKHTEETIKFSEFVSITKGMSISSLAAGDDFLELGLSATYNLRIQVSSGRDISAQLISTLGSDELPPIRIEIIGDGEVVTAELLEKRIHALRQMYAISLALDDNREDEIIAALKADSDVDLETKLIPEENKLIIRDAGTGSLILTVIAKSKKAYSAIVGLCALPYAEGRNALLRRVKADTSLKELSVEEKTIQLQLSKAHGVLDLLKKAEALKDPDAKKTIMEAIMSSSSALMPPVNLNMTVESYPSLLSSFPSGSLSDVPALPPPGDNNKRSGKKK